MCEKKVINKSTSELLELVKDPKIDSMEAALCNHGLSATHFLKYHQEWLYDTGIDDEEIRCKPKDFFNKYPTSWWRIDQVIFKNANK